MASWIDVKRDLILVCESLLVQIELLKEENERLKAGPEGYDTVH